MQKQQENMRFDTEDGFCSQAILQGHRRCKSWVNLIL